MYHKYILMAKNAAFYRYFLGMAVVIVLVVVVVFVAKFKNLSCNTITILQWKVSS